MLRYLCAAGTKTGACQQIARSAAPPPRARAVDRRRPQPTAMYKASLSMAYASSTWPWAKLDANRLVVATFSLQEWIHGEAGHGNGGCYLYMQ